MSYLLNAIYLCALATLSPWLVYKAITTGKYRRGLWAKLTGATSLSPGNPVWFHGVSVGEIHLLRQVIARWRHRHPDGQCIISTTTDTGFEEAKKHFPDVPIIYWPFDFSWAVERALRDIAPRLVVLAEGEIWPNFLLAAKRRGIPVATINGRMSPRSLARYQKLSALVRPLFRKLDLLAMQTERFAQGVRQLGARPERVAVTGNVKFDGVRSDRQNPKTLELAQLLDVRSGDLVWIAGSTQAPEEEIALDIYRRAKAEQPALRLILVPRQRERFDEVARLLERSGLSYLRRSQLEPRSVALGLRSSIILVDTIGELGALWGLADVAYVGGSMDGRRGGQNMIEPAAYGAAVLFGPHVWNFRETVEQLLQRQAAVQIEDAAELEEVVFRLLADADERQRRGAAAQRYVLEQQGATERTLDLLDQLLGQRAARRQAA
ncbi:MAG: 3-deoxy-D-manno-octulosonic acid transferase [Planctomycetia bacterium]|nr:3-deoxy-D-manno-octulosonic acid transferase [Planctomycetia bacterium]